MKWLASLLLLVSPAWVHAQNLIMDCDTGTVQGTVPLTVMYGAFDRAVQIYGAVNMVETQLLPQLRKGPGTFAFVYETTGVIGALDVPTCGRKSIRADLASGGIGMGYRWGPVSLFYAGSSTWLSFLQTSTPISVIASVGFPVVGALASPVAVAVHRFDFDEFSVSADFIAGAGLHLDFVDLLAGFVASRGLYASVFQGQSRLFVGGALSDGFQHLPYARLGVADLDWLYGDAAKTIGSTALYAERVEYSALPDASVARADVSDQSTVLFDYWTVHLDQLRIAGVLDMHAAMIVHPEVDLYDAELSWRASCLDNTDACDIPLTIGGGVMRKPTTWFYGSGGGYLPRAEVGIGRPGLFQLTVGLNDPAVVTAFPFAHNAVYVRMVFSADGLQKPTTDGPTTP